MRRSLVLLVLLSACGSERQVNRLRDRPEVVIGNPLPDAELRQGDGILAFDGLVTDSFDGPDTLEAWWVVDGIEVPAPIDANGGVALAVDPDGLALGEHTLGLGAIDTDGEEDFEEVTWTLVGPFGAPIVEITAPEDGHAVELGGEIVFRGMAEDATTPGQDLAFVWSSSIDAELAGSLAADGQTVLITSALSVGSHLITLTVTDGDGEIGTDAITVSVYDEPVAAEPGDLVFSELAVNPQVVEDMYGEWVELYNTSGSSLDIAGYSFHDLDYDRFVLSSVIVPPDSYVVLCANPDPLTNGGIETCDGGFVRTEMGGNGAMALGNSGDEVVLSRPDGTVIDEVVYDGSWFTPGVATGLDPSKLDGDNNDDETMWCDQTSILGAAVEPGTPGVENDPCPVE